MEWISVEDGLPKKHGLYIVCLGNKYTTCSEFTYCNEMMTESYFIEELDRSNFDCREKREDVTLWMPLPEPPK